MWPWTGPFLFWHSGGGQATLLGPTGQASVVQGENSYPSSVKTSLVIQLDNLSFKAFAPSLPKNKNRFFCSLVPLECCVISLQIDMFMTLWPGGSWQFHCAHFYSWVSGKVTTKLFYQVHHRRGKSSSYIIHMQHLTFSWDTAPLSYTYLNIMQLFPGCTQRE